MVQPIDMTNIFGKITTWLASPLFVGCLLTLFLSGLVKFYYMSYRDPEIVDQYPLLAEVERLHNQSIDFRLRQRGPRPGTDDVAVLTIDEKAIQKYGRWPWPRSYMAQVIDDIMENGAKTIAFDIIFSEKQETVLNSLEQVQKRLVQQIPEKQSLIANVFEKEKVDFDHDKKLSEVIDKHSDQLIMGAVYDEFSYRPHPYQDLCILDIAKSNGVYNYWEKEDYLIGIQNAAEINLPHTWHKIILRHFAELQREVTSDWLSSNPNHPLVSYIQSQGLSFESEEGLVALTHFIKGDRFAFDDYSKKGNLTWNKLSEALPNQTRVEIKDKMTRELNDYCLRYLTSKDELTPKFKDNWPQITKEYEKFSKISFEQASYVLKSSTLVNPIHHVDRWLFNIPAIAEMTVHTGTFNATQDKDGSVRRAKLFVRSGNIIIPSLAFKTFLVIKDLYPTANLIPNPYENPAESNIVTNVKLNNSEGKEVLTIPTDHRGQLPINYAGPQKMFSYLSASEILDGGNTLTVEQMKKNSDGEWVEQVFEVDKKEYLKDKNFVFGATATGIYDLRVTPFEENYPGVETHANMLDNLLRQDFLKTDPREEYLMPIGIFLLGVVFSFVVSYFGALPGLIITFISLISVYLVDAFLIFPQGTVITILFPIFTLLFLYTFLTFFKYFTEERKKKELKGTFQKYVSPEIVNEILKDPSKLELGGMKQEMSVFFSDIRGFTTISEKLDPKALSDLLNHYLTPMTEIIFKNSGTLDKYMGDAIMAFFGAPVPSKDHASQACRSALIQIDKLFELQKIYEERGLPMIDIGIGINTGEMSVGNMGSETVRNYTVMGDSVNLGSRLEGINKLYGTRIIISEFTAGKISKDEFLYREIDWVKVKGKNEPVKIYELMAQGDVPKEVTKKVEHFYSGFEFYHEQEWEKAIEEFNRALSFDASDQCSHLYIKRCQDYMKESPGKNWDGVFTMTTK